MKIFLDVIGCRLNQSEVEGFAKTFRAVGHQIVGDPAEADLAIVNTCAVTVKAAADSRKQLRRAAREGTPKVVATGCWATLHPDRALDLAGVTHVFTNQDKPRLVPEVLGLTPESLAKLNLVRTPLPGERARTRAFIKVQEGCDNHCTYCLTRLARGKSRSLLLEQVKGDIQAALAGEAKEIVLTGVQLGAWGRDLPDSRGLGDLMGGILSMKGIKRLRLSSIEPWDFNLKLLSFWQDQRMCRHLHLPLQSGHDRILKAMGRPFTRRAYLELVDAIRKHIPDIALTTDVIAGFPGETVQEFTTTQMLIQQVGFAAGHVFTYSPRPGTAAFKMHDQVPVHLAKTRNARLREIFNETGYLYRDQFIGTETQVLWETCKHTANESFTLSGLTDNYLRVYASSTECLSNQLSDVLIESHAKKNQALIGRILTGASRFAE
jgi:threonylcarbamoyladenosine tRNA methylthiotransferase MtaB